MVINLYGLSNSFAAITNILLAVFILIKGYRKKLSRIWATLSFCVAIYGLGAYKASGAGSYDSAFFWWQISYIGVIMLPALFAHFVYEFLEIKHSPLIKAVYLLCFLILVADILSPSLFVGHVSLKFQNSNWFTPAWWIYPPGPLHIFHTLILYVGLLTYIVIKLLRSYKGLNKLKQLQTKYFIVAIVLGFAGGGTSYLPCFGINLYPVLNITVAIYTFIIAYAIMRHHLMDIEVVIKKTLVFASLFLVAFGIFVGITVLTQELIAGGRLLGLAISSIIIIFAVRPLEDFLVKVTDKYLFQKKYDYTHLIRQFMDELKTMVLNVQDIAQSTLDFLGSSVRPTSSAIFMQNKFTNKYDLIASVDFKDKNIKMSDDMPLITELKNSGKIINVNRDKGLPIEEMDRLSKFGVELIIPLIIHKELLGIFFLGKKKSDENYNEEDIEALSNLSGALSIAINNAQLFDERADAEKRAMIGTLATGINHEIGNPLNIISIRLQSFRILAKQGLLAKKTKEEIIDEVNEITNICLESTNRISDITKKISEFAKPDKKLVLDKVNINEAIDETVSILQHELILERIKFEKNITCKSPQVMADGGQVKQILFNLIKNAAQALNGASVENGEITINVAKHGPKEISLKISDNGPGIPEKDVDKIFMPFYTTKEPGEGTGLGLSLVSRLIERNNAKIEVESKEGKGTTFTIIFKGSSYG